MTRRSNRHDRHDAPLQRRTAARARSKCGGLAWPLGVGRSGCRGTRRADSHCTHAAVARKRCPARSCMMMSETPLPTLPLGRSAKRALHQASRSAQSARRLRPPHHQEATRALSGGSTCRRSGVQRLRLWCRARSARPQPGCRRCPGAQRPRHRRRARSTVSCSLAEVDATDPGAARATTPAPRPMTRTSPCSTRCLTLTLTLTRSAGREPGYPYMYLNLNLHRIFVRYLTTLLTTGQFRPDARFQQRTSIFLTASFHLRPLSF